MSDCAKIFDSTLGEVGRIRGLSRRESSDPESGGARWGTRARVLTSGEGVPCREVFGDAG